MLVIQDDEIRKLLKYVDELSAINTFEMTYDDVSVRQIDQLLDSFHKEYMKEDVHDHDSLSGIALSIGVYIGEVVRMKFSNLPARWVYGRPDGEDSEMLFMQIADGELYFVDWVRKHIENGKEESVFNKFIEYSEILEAKHT